MHTSMLLPATLLAITHALPQAINTHCVPTLYTLSDYTLTTTPSDASLTFTFQSTFADAIGIDDTLRSGATCKATGSPTIPNSNDCNMPKRNLLVDLRAPVEQGLYRITHTWRCDGKEWISGNDVTAQQVCEKVGTVTTCTAAKQSFVPQNVRQIAQGP